MTTPHEQPPETTPVLEQKLNPDELRVLLERLEAHQAREREMTTIGAVAEATGADPGLIRQMLAEIRHVPPPVIQEPQSTHDFQARRRTTTTTGVIVAVILAALLAMFLVFGFFATPSVRVEVREDPPQPTGGN